MLRKIVSIIVRPLLPIDDKLSIFNPIAYPIETHVDGLAAFLLEETNVFTDYELYVCSSSTAERDKCTTYLVLGNRDILVYP